MNKKKIIIRRFEISKEQGAASLLIRSKAEGLFLDSFFRKGKNVTVIYKRRK